VRGSFEITQRRGMGGQLCEHRSRDWSDSELRMPRMTGRHKKLEEARGSLRESMGLPTL
jgi:hypothetical protein